MRRVGATLWMLVAMMPMLAHATSDFDAWVQEFKPKAIEAGVPDVVVAHALDGLTTDERVIAFDQKQPENKISLAKYLTNTINNRRIIKGAALLEEHEALLQEVSQRYEVQPRYLVALWGIESDYGGYQGNFSVVRSLATLAYEGRRREFFTNELIAALKIIADEGMEPAELTGSWAGAMGNCQFMPSTYLKYAADGDGDGHRDIWHSTEDTLASIANYLHALGWKNDRGMATPLVQPVPEGLVENSFDHGRKAWVWRERGIAWEESNAAFKNDMKVYAVYTDENNRVAHMVTDNFKAILEWNRSRYFATAVETLATRISADK